MPCGPDVSSSASTDDRSKPEETANYEVCAGIASRTPSASITFMISGSSCPFKLEEVAQITHGQVGEYFHIQRAGAEAEEPNRHREILDQRVLCKQAAGLRHYGLQVSWPT